MTAVAIGRRVCRHSCLAALTLAILLVGVVYATLLQRAASS